MLSGSNKEFTKEHGGAMEFRHREKSVRHVLLKHGVDLSESVSVLVWTLSRKDCIKSSLAIRMPFTV